MAIAVIYNIEELAKILEPKGITRTSLYRAIALGKLKAVKVGKRYIISETAVNSYLEGYSYMRVNVE
ncbi:helix-turn-helix domain-containing protein [Candidatus Clostridium radicumherbarum]|uniref:Helix-turn-helix domain-containing protein n=1 Tax=Candidatus Clostridium radicumherbarum TaxID=3381662 RepID=A0ABW8TU62_9CLOT